MQERRGVACAHIFTLKQKYGKKQEDPRMTDKDRREMEDKFRRELFRYVGSLVGCVCVCVEGGGCIGRRLPPRSD